MNPTQAARWIVLVLLLVPSLPLRADDAVPPADNRVSGDFQELSNGKTITLTMPEKSAPSELPSFKAPPLTRISKPVPEPLPPFLQKLQKLSDRVNNIAKSLTPQTHLHMLGTEVKVSAQVSASNPGLFFSAPFPDRISNAARATAAKTAKPTRTKDTARQAPAPKTPPPAQNKTSPTSP